jgi:hypothetical protein
MSANAADTQHGALDDLEKQAYDTDDAIQDHVDVQFAENQFEELKRRYSNLSRVASANSQSEWNEKHTRKAIAEDVESSEGTDLEDILRDRRAKELENGTKPKHLGINLSSKYF